MAGYHHAHFSYGSGYCMFNDLAICAIKAINEYKNINDVLIIDLDVHQGDGTASILKIIEIYLHFLCTVKKTSR